jgi:hypothetical protein
MNLRLAAPASILMCLLPAAAVFANGETAEPVAAVWNSAVDSYENGDFTNALRLARQLMLEKSHAARAGELAAKLEYDRGNREEAAAAAQIALRAAPESARAKRNFTRAVDGLAEIRRTRRINEVLKAAQGKDPGGMMLAARNDVRALMAENAAAATNNAAQKIAFADRASTKAVRLAETWIAVREAVAASLTNETQAAGILSQASDAEGKMMRAAKELSDIDGGAGTTLAEAEDDCNRFAKMLAAPPGAIEECVVAQSNAWQDVEAFNSRPWQREALDYTRAFRAKFPAWAKAYEQSAQADTNKPPFTAEDQAKISALAVELEKLQLECTEKLLPPKQELALQKAVEIRNLLPKDGSGGGGGQGGGGQNQQPQGKNDASKEPQPQEEQPQRNDGGEDGNENDEEQKEEEQPGGDGEQQQDDGDKEVEAILKKAQERNDEHEAEKKLRMRKSPLAPNERDW